MPNMDENAANSGDRLKHTLLLEVLSRCLKWECLVYSETHAGAGIFSAKSQMQKGRHYIADLEATVTAVKINSESTSSGARYISLLKSWWSDSTHNGTYPGSVVQAACFLKKVAKNAQFRITEALAKNCERLETALNDFDIKPRHGPFQTNLDWLCDGDDVVMLVDPWAIIGRAKDTEERNASLSNGKVDLDTLDDILARLWVKRNAVIMLWTSYGQANRQHKYAVERHLETWSQTKNATLRTFHDGNNRYVYLMGVGDGEVVICDSWPQKYISECVNEL